MLALNKKTDYALMALGYLAEHADRLASAREIADVYRLPLPLLMQILKALHQGGMVRSMRGVKGGYQLAADLSRLSLADLVGLLERVERETSRSADSRLPATEPVVPRPLQVLRQQLQQFLQDVMVSDLVHPRKGIDVPLARLGIAEHGRSGSREPQAIASIPLEPECVRV